MVTETLKAAAITGYDTVPPTKPAGGAGASNGVYLVNDFITSTTGKTTGSIYRLVRVRSDCYVKRVVLESAAQGSGTTLSFGLYYSDAPTAGVLDGTQVALSGTVINAAFFATSVDVSSAVTPTNITNQTGTYTVDKRNQPIWQAAGLASDPGGFFDIAATSTATINTGALFGITAEYNTV